MSKDEPIFGIDVHSEYQRGLNFERARAEGYEFCVVKATEGPYRDGERYVPSGFKEFFRRAEAEGFVMGVYHFLVSTPGKAQADHFLRTIEDVGGPEDKILMVDFEEYGSHPALTPGNDELGDFIAEVRRRVGNHPIVVYSGRGFWNGGDSSGDFSQYGADVAWDAYYLHMDPVQPRRFYADSEQSFQNAGLSWGWGKRWGDVEPWFWQFTSAGGVAGMNIDVNAYRGTREQLLALTGAKVAGGIGGAGAGHEGDGDQVVALSGNGGGGRKVLTHGVVDGTYFAEGYKYVMQLNDRMKYWVWSHGPVPDGEGAYAVDDRLPPVDQLKGKKIFCFPGDTLVSAPPIGKSYSRFYSGEVVTIETASGNKLTGTPNHPVLTDKGWIPLKALKKGSHVLSSPGFWKRAGLNPDYYNEPTSFEEMHRSLADAGHVERYVGGPLDFHGDGMNGEIDVVVPERVLRDGREAAMFEKHLKLGFSDTPAPDAALAVPGATDQIASGVGALPRFVGSAHLGQPLSFGERAVFQALRLGDASQLDSCHLEASGDGKASGTVTRRYGARRFAREIVSDDGFGVEVETVDRGFTRPTTLPMKAGAVAEGPPFDPGLVEAGVDTGHGHAELFGDLRRGQSLLVGMDEVIGIDVVAPPGFGLDPGHTVDFAAATQLDTGLEEPASHGVSADAYIPHDLFEGLPLDVHFDKVVDVDVGVFEGHVYNLQTQTDTYIANGILAHNCAGVPNLFRRAAGKCVPTRGNRNFDGGIAAYFYTSAFGGLGPGFFSGVDVPFNLATAKKWARETGSGVLIGRSYRNNSLAGQGHVAILLPDGKVLQSFQFGAGEPGLNTNFTIEESHSGNYYEVMAHPKAWINHDKNQLREVKLAPAKAEKIEVPEKAGAVKPGDDRPDGTETRVDVGKELTEDELEEIGREVLELIRRYAGQTKASRRRSKVRHEKEGD